MGTEMKFRDYQTAAMRSANPNSGLEYAALSIAGESGEFVDIIKKHIYHGHKLDRKAALEELGDILWGIAFAVDCLGGNLDEVAQANIDKLKARYPDGFSEEASRNRLG